MVDKSRNAPSAQTGDPGGPDEPEFIFRRSFVTNDGRRIYARDYGLKAFMFPRRY